MRVVMTGAAGGVATLIRPCLRKTVSELILSDLDEIEDLQAGERSIPADLTDLSSMTELLKGADGLIHLGGQSVEGTWDQVLNANIIGLHNTYEAARSWRLQADRVCDHQPCRRLLSSPTDDRSPSDAAARLALWGEQSVR